MDNPVKEGDIIDDRYRVERVIGTGGMAVVVAAIDLQVPERVAIKFLFRKAAKVTEILLRFEREQEVIQRLQGEHIARMLAGGVYKNAPYMVMEYLQGRDLADVLRVQGPLPSATACEYILQTCEAVAEAHALDIVHRDLKPGNLFLTHRQDGSSCIKVLDFGIAKIIDPDRSPEESSLTQAQTVMGSPFYMSPEQMLSSKDVDAATDIWALGVIAFELLTGKLPFGSGSAEQLCMRVLNEDPAMVRELNADCPEGLDQAIHRCLQRMPKNRHPNVGELAASIAPFAPPHARAALPRIFHILDFPGEVPASTETDQEIVAVRDPEEPPEAPTVYLSKPRPAGKKHALLIAFGVGMLALGFAGGMFMRGGNRQIAPAPPATATPPAAAVLTAEPRPSTPAEEPEEDLVVPEAPIEMDLDEEAARMAAERRERAAERAERDARRAERAAAEAARAEHTDAAPPSTSPGSTARPASSSASTVSPSKTTAPSAASSTTRPRPTSESPPATTTAPTTTTAGPAPTASPTAPETRTVPPSTPRSPQPPP